MKIALLMQVINSIKIDQNNLLKAENETFDASSQFHQKRHKSYFKGQK